MRLWRVVLGSLPFSWIHCMTWWGRFGAELDWIAYWLVLASFWLALGVAWELSACRVEPETGGTRGDAVNVMIPYRIGVLIWLMVSWNTTRSEIVPPFDPPSQIEIASAALAALWCAALAAYDIAAAETRGSAIFRLLAYHLLACVALAVAATDAVTPLSGDLHVAFVSLWIAAAISLACLLAARHRRILFQPLRAPPPLPVARAVSAGGARSPRA